MRLTREQFIKTLEAMIEQAKEPRFESLEYDFECFDTTIIIQPVDTAEAE